MSETIEVRGKTSGLAIAALVLACLFFIPFLPLVGAILGIVGAATIRPPRRGRGLAIAAIPTGFVVVFFLQGILAAVAIPAFIKYTRKSKTIEATEGLMKLRAGARAFAAADRYDKAGNPLPKGFLRGKTGWVPATACCSQATTPKCTPSADDWNKQPWKGLHFALSDPHYFQWRYLSNGRQLVFEARADLDCDGVYSSYKLLGELSANGQVEFRGPIIRDEIE